MTVFQYRRNATIESQPYREHVLTVIKSLNIRSRLVGILKVEEGGKLAF